MSQPVRNCASCGGVIDSETPGGLCPGCLLKAGLASGASSLASAKTRVIARGEVLPAGEFAPATPGNPGTGASGSFGNYEILEELARGGMGVVYKARQRSLNRIVALKMILSGSAAAEAEVQRFQTEGEAAAHLQHPNIVNIIEVGESQGQPFFSMEYIEGQTLAELLYQRPLPPALAAKYLRTIAEAIHYAHERGILHRDLKPSNVIIDASGQPHVTDFGLAKRLEAQSGLTHSGAVVGTPSYMSPEQACGKTEEIGPATDIYSLGAILYEAVTGRPPFRAATPVDTMRMVVETDPAAPRWVNPNVPRDLDTICLKCLEKNPKRRYTTVRELAADLQRFLGHEPIKARPATPVDRTLKWINRKPALASMLGLLAVVIAAGFWGVDWQRRKAVASSQVAKQEAWTALVGQSRAEQLLGRRDASLQKIAQAAQIARRPELRSEAIQTIAQPGIRHLLNAPFADPAMSVFSPDGSLLAVCGTTFVPPEWPGYGSNAYQSVVELWDTSTGKRAGRKPWSVEGGPVAFSGDSRFLAVPQVEKDERILIWKAKASRPKEDGEGETWSLPAFGAPRFSPDGTRIAVQERAGVSVWTNAPGVTEPIMERFEAASVVAWLSPHVLLLQNLHPQGKGRLVRWNVVTGQEMFPLNDTAYVRARDGTPQPLPGHQLNASMETVMAISADGSTAVTRLLAPKTTNYDVFVRSIAGGTNVTTLKLMPIPEQVALSPNGRRLAFPDPVESGRFRIFDVSSGKFLGGAGLPGTYLEQAFDGFRLGEVHASGTASSNNKVVRYERRPVVLNWGNVARPKHPWPSLAANMSPDGALMAAASSIGQKDLTVWELDTGRAFASLPGAERPFWSADGRWLAVRTHGMIEHNEFMSTGDSIQVWQMFHGVPSHRLPSEVDSVAFSPDGRTLTANGRGWHSLAWKVERKAMGSLLLGSAERLREEQLLFGTEQSWAVNSPDVYYSGALVRARLAGSKQTPVQLKGGGTVEGRALSPDGRRILIGLGVQHWMTNAFMTNSHFQLWNLAEGRMEAAWPHPGNGKDNFREMRPGPVVYSPDGRHVASACFSYRGIELWDAQTGQRLHQLRPPPPATFRVMAPPRRNPLSELVGRILGRRPAPISMQTGPVFQENMVRSIVFSPDSKLVISGSEDRAVVREVASGRTAMQCVVRTNLMSLAISPDGRTLAIGDEGRTVYLWDLASGKELARWQAHDSAVTALAFSPDGTTLVSGSREGSMKLWNLPFVRRELAAIGLDW